MQRTPPPSPGAAGDTSILTSVTSVTGDGRYQDIHGFRTRYMTKELLEKCCGEEELGEAVSLEIKLPPKEKVKRIENLDLVPNLQTLKIPNQRVTKIENIAHLSDLRVLSLRGNQIEKLDLPVFKFLTVLDVSKNLLEDIPLNLGRQCPLLKEASFKDCQIKALSKIQSIRQCRNLEILNLKGNPVTDAAHYRSYVVWATPTVIKLDDMAVDMAEREEAAVRWQREELTSRDHNIKSLKDQLVKASTDQDNLEGRLSSQSTALEVTKATIFSRDKELVKLEAEKETIHTLSEKRADELNSILIELILVKGVLGELLLELDTLDYDYAINDSLKDVMMKAASATSNRTTQRVTTSSELTQKVIDLEDTFNQKMTSQVALKEQAQKASTLEAQVASLQTQLEAAQTQPTLVITPDHSNGLHTANRVQHLEDTLESERTRIVALSQDLEVLRKDKLQHVITHQQLEEERVKVVALQRQIETANTSNETAEILALEREVRSLREQVIEAENTIEQLNEEVKAKDSGMDEDTMQKVMRMEEENDELREHYGGALARLEATEILREQAEKKASEAVQIEGEVALSNDQLETGNKKLRALLEAAEQRARSLEADIAALTNDKRVHIVTQQQLSEALSKATSLETVIAEKDSYITSLKSEVKVLETANYDILNDSGFIRPNTGHDMKDLEGTVNTLKGDLSSAQKDSLKQTQTIEALQEKVRTLQEHSVDRQLDWHDDSINGEKDALENEVRELTAKVKSLQQELHDLREAARQHDRTVADLKNLDEKYRKAGAEREVREAEKDDTIEKLRKTILDLQNGKSDAARNMNDCIRQIDGNNETIMCLEEELETANQKFTDLQAQGRVDLAELMKKLEALQADLDKVSSENSENKKAKEKLEAETGRLRRGSSGALADDSDDMMTTSRQGSYYFKNSRASIEAKTHTHSRLSEATGKVETLETVIEQKDIIISTLQSELRELEAVKDQGAGQELALKFEETRQVVEEREETIRKLRADVEELSTRCKKTATVEDRARHLEDQLVIQADVVENANQRTLEAETLLAEVQARSAAEVSDLKRHVIQLTAGSNGANVPELKEEIRRLTRTNDDLLGDENATIQELREQTDTLIRAKVEAEKQKELASLEAKAIIAEAQKQAAIESSHHKRQLRELQHKLDNSASDTLELSHTTNIVKHTQSQATQTDTEYQVRTLQHDIDELKQQLKEEKQRQLISSNTSVAYEANLKSTEEEVEHLTKVNKVAKEEIRLLKDGNTTLRKQLNTFRMNVEPKDEVAVLREELRIAKALNSELLTSNESHELLKQLNESEKGRMEAEARETRYARQLRELYDAKDREVVCVDSENRETRNVLAEVDASNLRTKLDKAAAALANSNAKNAELHDAATRATAAEVEMSRLNDLVASLEIEKASMVGELQHYKQQASRLADMTATCSQLKAEVGQLTSDKKILEQRYAALCQELEALRGKTKASGSTVTQLNAKLVASEDEVKALTQLKQNLETEMMGLKRGLEMAEVNIKAKRQQYEEEQRRADAALDNLHAVQMNERHDTEALNSKMREIETEKTNLKYANMSLEQQLVTLRRSTELEIKELRSKVSQTLEAGNKKLMDNAAQLREENRQLLFEKTEIENRYKAEQMRNSLNAAEGDRAKLLESKLEQAEQEKEAAEKDLVEIERLKQQVKHLQAANDAYHKEAGARIQELEAEKANESDTAAVKRVERTNALQVKLTAAEREVEKLQTELIQKKIEYQYSTKVSSNTETRALRERLDTVLAELSEAKTAHEAASLRSAEEKEWLVREVKELQEKITTVQQHTPLPPSVTAYTTNKKEEEVQVHRIREVQAPSVPSLHHPDVHYRARVSPTRKAQAPYVGSPLGDYPRLFNVYHAEDHLNIDVLQNRPHPMDLMRQSKATSRSSSVKLPSRSCEVTPLQHPPKLQNTLVSTPSDDTVVVPRKYLESVYHNTNLSRRYWQQKIKDKD